MKNAQRNPAAKVLRALSSLVDTAAANGCGVRELAATMQIPPSAAHRLLGILAASDYVRRVDETARYVLGPELLRIANIAARYSLFGQPARPRMQTLADACNESVLLGYLDPVRLEMMFVEIIESRAPLRYSLDLNVWMPLYAGASGLAIMAFLPSEQIDSIIERTHLAPITDQTITDPARLKAELRLIRQRGYALTRGQRLNGAVGIAAPIFGANGKVIGDVCLTIPQQRFDPRDPRLPKLLVDCASALTRDSGGHVPATAPSEGL